MKTVWLGQEKYIVRGGRHFAITEESSDAAVQAEWADSILSRPAVTYQNGRNSHQVAGEVLEQAEDVLLDYLVIC